MKYSSRLRKVFSEISLKVEDLLLLESFQIAYLPDRVPRKEFSTVIREFPFVRHFLLEKNPSIGSFMDSVLKENEKIEDRKTIEEHCDELLWEIADLLVYNKYPGLYDEKVKFTWTMDEIIARQALAGKVVADVGAGSGFLAFMLARFAGTVYAIEPISSFRNFIRQKASKLECRNLYTTDGFLDAIPLPDNTIDMLFTSNAIGWKIKDELPEIERVVKPNGLAIHLMRVKEDTNENPVHEILVSRDWNYTFSTTTTNEGVKLKYSKTVI